MIIPDDSLSKTIISNFEELTISLDSDKSFKNYLLKIGSGFSILVGFM